MLTVFVCLCVVSVHGCQCSAYVCVQAVCSATPRRALITSGFLNIMALTGAVTWYLSLESTK